MRCAKETHFQEPRRDSSARGGARRRLRRTTFEAGKNECPGASASATKSVVSPLGNFDRRRECSFWTETICGRRERRSAVRVVSSLFRDTSRAGGIVTDERQPPHLLDVARARGCSLQPHAVSALHASLSVEALRVFSSCDDHETARHFLGRKRAASQREAETRHPNNFGSCVTNRSHW